VEGERRGWEWRVGRGIGTRRFDGGNRLGLLLSTRRKLGSLKAPLLDDENLLWNQVEIRFLHWKERQRRS